MIDPTAPNTLGPFVDRRGTPIDESLWKRMRAISGYQVVRRYDRASHLPGEPVHAVLIWYGYPAAQPFELSTSERGFERYATEAEGISAYEDFLMSKGCGEWFPSGGTLNRDGKQVSSSFTFASIGNVHREEGSRPSAVAEAMVENENYASW